MQYIQYVHIVLSTTSGTPMYEQIKDQVRSAVYGGALTPGQPLPSQRELARDLQVSLITVTRAYNDLVAEGIIGARQGRGTVVLDVDPHRVRAHLDVRIDQSLRAAIIAAQLGGRPIDDLTQRLSRLWDEEQPHP